jgi:hypothetical protein
MDSNIVEISTSVCMTSLVGIYGEPPVSHGNYCSVNEGYLLNMWAENLEDLTSKGILDGKMKAIKFGRGNYVVVDERIPEEYLNKKPCFTSCNGGFEDGDKRMIHHLCDNSVDLNKCLCDQGIFSWNKAYVGKGLKGGMCYECRVDITEIKYHNRNKKVIVDKLNELQLDYKQLPGKILFIKSDVYSVMNELLPDPKPKIIKVPWIIEQGEPIICGGSKYADKPVDISNYVTGIIKGK